MFGKYSLALLPPKKWLNEIGVAQGDFVELEFDRKRKKIVLKFKENNTIDKSWITEKPNSKPKKNNDDRLKKELITKDQTEDWQSIPEL